MSEDRAAFVRRLAELAEMSVDELVRLVEGGDGGTTSPPDAPAPAEPAPAEPAPAVQPAAEPPAGAPNETVKSPGKVK